MTKKDEIQPVEFTEIEEATEITDLDNVRKMEFTSLEEDFKNKLTLIVKDLHFYFLIGDVKYGVGSYSSKEGLMTMNKVLISTTQIVQNEATSVALRNPNDQNSQNIINKYLYQHFLYLDKLDIYNGIFLFPLESK